MRTAHKLDLCTDTNTPAPSDRRRAGGGVQELSVEESSQARRSGRANVAVGLSRREEGEGAAFAAADKWTDSRRSGGSDLPAIFHPIVKRS